MVGVYRAIGVACLVIILRWIWKLLNWAWLEPMKLEKCLRRQGLQGNSHNFLFGDVKHISKLQAIGRQKPLPHFTNDYFSRVLLFQHQLLTKYGKNCFSWSGPVPVIHITEPELMRDAFMRMNEFRKQKVNPLIRMLAPGLASYEGKKWALHRKLLTPAFHLDKLKLMLPAYATSVMEIVNKWEELVTKTDSSSGSGSCEIDVFPYLSNLSADVISRAAFGSSYEEGTRIFELLKEQIQVTLRLFHTVYLPGMRYLPTKTNKRVKELNDEIQRLLMGIIEKRKKGMEAKEAYNDDLLGILMESNLRETQSQGSNNKQLGMSYKDMIDECKLFYTVGQETTSLLLVWTMILLGKHPYWQTRAREEVFAIFGKNQPNYDELNQLKIVTMILYEVLRLYPPLPTITKRVYDHESKLGNLMIPPGTMVTFSILHVHHDQELWGEDAKEFNPERFSEGIAKATKGNISFFPFGWGPRICIGQNFAILEAKMTLALILQRFSFELSPTYAHAPTTVPTIQPQFGAPIVLRQL